MAYDWRLQIMNFRKDRDSLVEFLEEDATSAMRDFQMYCESVILTEGSTQQDWQDHSPPSYVHFSLSHTYEQALSRLANARPGAVGPVIEQHCAILAQGSEIGISAWRSVANAHRNASEAARSLAVLSGNCGNTALGEWLFSWVRS